MRACVRAFVRVCIRVCLCELYNIVYRLFYLQGQCTLINITVNVPELAQKAIFSSVDP